MAGAVALGIDIGGTFTDIVVAGPQGVLAVAKQLTTSHDPADAAVLGAQVALARAGIGPGQVTRVVHGTTLATNAILERRDVPVAFVTTRGFAGLLQLGRHARVEDERYDLGFESPAPPVEAALTFEVAERIGARGEIVEALDDAAVIALVHRIRALDVRSVAVCLLHSYINAEHERRVGEILRDVLGTAIDVVLSCDVWPEVREYERATTTVMSAFVGPIMSGYLETLEARLDAIGVHAPLFIMESSGGVMSATVARRRAVTTIESGPAAGVIAAKVVGADHGFDDVIAFDMGGTTAKAALITGGEPDVTHQFQVGGKGSFGSRRSGTGIPIKAPTIDLAEVGAGGGSIAWVDDQGALHVGPHSAGSSPGPVCYGRGGVEPTVTDASVVLGYLDPQGFAPDELSFDAAASRAAIVERLAVPLGISAERAAAAVHEIANATMAGAIHVVTVQRGVDPRGYVLVTSGGAGPLHAPRIAERFGITSIVVPPACGVASALGLLASDLRTDRVRTVNIDDADLAPSDLATRFADLERAAVAELAPASEGGVQLRRSVDVRYRGQSHELNVVLAGADITASSLAALRDDFFRQHREAFGVGSTRPIELVNLRVRATRAVAHAAFSRPSAGAGVSRHPTSRDVWFAESGGFVSTPVHQLGECPIDVAIDGPALLEAPESTVLVAPGWSAAVASSGAVTLTRLEAPAGPDQTSTEANADQTSTEANADQTSTEANADQTSTEANADQTSTEANADQASTDAVEDDVVRYGLLVAAEEAAIAVVRAAHSQFIVEGSDAGIGILDRGGQLIAEAAATSILHSGGIVEQLAAVLEDIPIDTMQPGDVFITNDPYRGGVHANDVMLCRPVFVDNAVRYFTASLIHVLDLGGSAHGGINAAALETFEEGLQLPPLHWERAGARNDDLVRLIQLNSRSPGETIGDIDALAAGTLVAANRLEAMIHEHGAATFDAIVERYLQATEARTRSEIRRVADGVYRGSGIIDDDGINPGRSYDIAVEVRVADDAIALDFAGTSPQVRAPINSSASQAYDASMFAVRCFLDKDIPTNSGSFRPVVAEFPRGSLLNPDAPNPCGGRMMAVYAIVDAIIEALSIAVPERRIAWSGILQGFSVAGIGSAYWLHNSYDFGGVGGRVGKDGVDATGLHFGVGRNGIPQVEPVERRCRLRVEAVELIVDSGGAGQWRGGLGARTAFRLLDDCLVSVRTDRFHSPPEGIDGGHAARAGAFYRVTADGRRIDIGSKAVNVRLDNGDAFVMETSGGGGVGDPLRRSRAAVAADVRAGKISRAAARHVYGFEE